MMAFVYNKIAVFSHKIIYHSFSTQALNCCDIYSAGWITFTSADLANITRIDIEKSIQSRDPLMEKLF